jgi:signal transduction histidine kinase/ActR/RegA family two-component response regulator
MSVGASRLLSLSPLVKLVEATQGTGDQFFEGLVKGLCETFGVRRAIVVEAHPDVPGCFRTIAIWDHGQLQPNEVLTIRPPCLHVLEGRTVLIPECARTAYPDNPSLAELGTESYVGTPFISSAGVVIGYIALLHDGPLDLSLHPDSTLQLFAARAAAEIERWRAEAALRQTEQRERERAAELDVLTRTLREHDLRKDEFLAMLGHELRNLLAPIRHVAELLRRATPDDVTVNWSRRLVERQLKQMTRLVDDLLDVSRLTKGKIRLQPDVIDVGEIVTRTVETLALRAEQRRQTLRVEIPATTVAVFGDEVRLTQVVANLLDNAMKYTGVEGTIGLTVELSDRDVLIRVADNGIGIAPDVLPRIFDLFAQGEASLERSAGGLGIGLTLVRRLVEMHGGRVTATSPGLGRGAEFVVSLPVASAAPLSESRAARGSRVPSSPPRRILIADDSLDAATALSALLRLDGHHVLMVHDGQTALERAHIFLPEVVILDIGLPGMSGLEVARSFRSIPEYEGLLLIATTGYGRDDDRRRSLEAGFDHHLVKPFEPEALEAIIAAFEPPASTAEPAARGTRDSARA